MGAWRSDRRPGKKSRCVSSHRLIGFVGMGWFRPLRFPGFKEPIIVLPAKTSLYICIVTYIYVSIYRVVLFFIGNPNVQTRHFKDCYIFQQSKTCFVLLSTTWVFLWCISVKSWFGDGLVTKSSLTLMTPSTIACQAPLSMGFPRQEIPRFPSGLLFPSRGDLPNPGIEPTFPALAGGFLTAEPPGLPKSWCTGTQVSVNTECVTEINDV